MTTTVTASRVSADGPAALDLTAIRAAYGRGLTPQALMGLICDRIEARGDDHIWIHRVPRDELTARAEAVEALRAAGAELPLYGVPFAIKDNIDAAGMPTTAGCPAYAYEPAEAAPVVQRLEEAGAILVGKTNLDQFATGLVGVRSPYGVPANPFDPAYVPGGSSSGSAVAVAAGLVSFALGTDTAGSGRVPAAFNNIVGLKPSRGLLSTRGVVPACRSLDCVSIFASTADDAAAILAVAAAFDAADPFSRPLPAEAPEPESMAGVRLGVPAGSQLNFFGDADTEALFAAAVERAREAGAEIVDFDYAPFREAAALLYDGPWVAERYAAVGAFIEDNVEAVDPTVAGIVLGGARPSAADAFAASYRLAALRRAADAAFRSIDAILLPTAGTVYTVEQVVAEPVALNSNLGAYTNFMNLLNLCGVAVPAGFRADGLPFGVTLAAPAFHDRFVCELGAVLHTALGGTMGATGKPLPERAGRIVAGAEPDRIEIVVFGAHMTGEPLNPVLVGYGARFLGAGRTAPIYRFLALPGAPPARPGLIRVDGGGASIELERWSLPRKRIGDLLASIPAPLGLGTVELDDGRSVNGFICEGYVSAAAEDITEFGGWRAFLAATRDQSFQA